MADSNMFDEQWPGDGFGKSRPRLEIPLSQTEVFLDLISAAVAVCFSLYLAAVWKTIPAMIPAHFNFAGRVDRWDSKNTLLLLHGITVALYVGLSVLQRFPNVCNYPFKLTPGNIRQQYRIARQLIIALKAIVVCQLAFIEWQSIQIAQGNAVGMYPWSMPFFMILIFGTIVVYFVLALKAR